MEQLLEKLKLSSGMLEEGTTHHRHPILQETSLEDSRLQETHLEELIQRAEGFLEVNLFRRALEESERYLEEAELRAPPSRQVLAQEIKAKALFGLRKYEESVNFLKEAVSAWESSKEKEDPSLWAPLPPLILQGSVLLQQHLNGGRSIRMSSLLPNRKAKVGVTTLAEYSSPAITIGVEITGKGRGVVASQSIPKGTLLLASRAVEIIFDTEDEDDELEEGIAGRMALDPSLIPEVYELSAGAGGEWAGPGPSIELKRISAICTMNSFGNSRNSSGYGHNSRGLWLLPSFFNHDCIDFNCVWKVLGDFLFIRTVRDCGVGEELTISYTDSADVFEEREKFFRAHEFCCACRLCAFQSKEPIALRVRRLELLDKLKEIEEKKRELAEDIEVAEECLRELDGMGVEGCGWNFAPHVALDLLVKLYVEKGEIGSAVDAAERYYGVVNVDGGCLLEVGAGGQVASLLLKAGDVEGAKRWMKVLRSDLSTVYGQDPFVIPALYPQLHLALTK